MKFNWGTGILIFLILFLAACTVFIVFAMRQDVNLVHKDYYEKGVDHTEQMNVDSRSKQFDDDVHVKLQNEYLQISLSQSLVSSIDSGNVLLYRPSNSKNDIIFPMTFTENNLIIPNDNLISGRYIVKLFWYTDGLKYEIDKPVDIQ